MIPEQSKKATAKRIFFSKEVSFPPLLLTEIAVIDKTTIDTKHKIPSTIAKFPTEFNFNSPKQIIFRLNPILLKLKHKFRLYIILA